MSVLSLQCKGLSMCCVLLRILWEFVKSPFPSAVQIGSILAVEDGDFAFTGNRMHSYCAIQLFSIIFCSHSKVTVSIAELTSINYLHIE